MKVFLLVLLFCFAFKCNAQKKVWTKLIINPNLKIDTGFNQKWSYKWYMVKHDDGHFENTLVDSVTAEDTAHQFYTAACINTHMGIHEINYCNAATYNDDVEMRFSGPSPGYNEAFTIVIRKNHFSGRYNFESVVLEQNKKIRFEIISQKLVLKKKPVYGKMITGIVEVGFRRKVQHIEKRLTEFPVPIGTPVYSKIYTLKGRFHTPLDEVIDIE